MYTPKSVKIVMLHYGVGFMITGVHVYMHICIHACAHRFVCICYVTHMYTLSLGTSQCCIVRVHVHVTFHLIVSFQGLIAALCIPKVYTCI